MDEKMLLELSDYIVAEGERKGATAVEALVRSVNDVDVNIESGEISGVERRTSDQVSIRLYVGKRMGSAFTNIPTNEAAGKAIDMALSSAKVTTEDADWVSLPEPGDYNRIEGLWSDAVAKCEPAKVVEIAGDFMARATEAEEGLIPAYGGSGVGVYHSAYSNSNGIAHAEKGGLSYAVLGAIAQIEGGVTPMILSYDIKRGMDLDLNRCVDEIATTLRVCKKRAEGKTGEHTVVMHPGAYGQIFSYTLLQAVKGDNVARGKSKLEGRIGEAIASEIVTVVDDGTLPRGVNTSIADDEGVPRRRTPIIEDGVLGSFLWDTYWGNKEGEESTGNASRSMRRGLVDIAPTNMVIETGKRSFGEIVSEIDHGYLIRGVQGAHSSNPESGDFSVVGNPAILIEAGEPVGAVHGLMVSGNVFELLGKCVEAAGEAHTLQGLIGPELVFDGASVIARG